jgi:hypothetical protein
MSGGNPVYLHLHNLVASHTEEELGRTAAVVVDTAGHFADTVEEGLAGIAEEEDLADTVVDIAAAHFLYSASQYPVVDHQADNTNPQRLHVEAVRKTCLLSSIKIVSQELINMKKRIMVKKSEREVALILNRQVYLCSSS